MRVVVREHYDLVQTKAEYYKSFTSLTVQYQETDRTAIFNVFLGRPDAHLTAWPLQGRVATPFHGAVQDVAERDLGIHVPLLTIVTQIGLLIWYFFMDLSGRIDVHIQ